MRRRTWTLLLSFACLLAAPAFAAERLLTLDPENTRVSFTLGATGHDVEGLFHLRAGSIRFDPQAGTASGEVAIDAGRAETGNKRRDKAMHRKVLESADHPLIVFTPRQLRGELAESGASQLELVGSVALLGVEHPLTLPTRLEVDGDTVTAEATFSVPYVEWGLHDPSMFILKVAKEVEVTVSMTGTFGATSAGTPAAGN